MNYKKHIFYPLTLLLLLASACSQEEKMGNDSMEKGLTIAMTIAPATSGIDTKAPSVTAPLPGESTFDNAHLLIYKKGAVNTDWPILVRSTTTANQAAFSIGDTELSLQEGSTYDIYIIAGLPTGTTAPDQNTTKGQLMRFAAGKPESTPDAPKLTFTGQAELIYKYSAGGMNVTVPLQRIVARADIRFINLDAGRVANVYVSDIAASTPYWGSSSKENGYCNIQATPDATDKSLYRAYINENYTTPNSKKASAYVVIADADGSNEVAYQVIINTGAIERNKIYELTLTVLKDRLIIVSGNGVIDWVAAVGSSVETSPLKAVAKANSYIVAPGGNTIFIPVEQVVDANAFDSSIPVIGALETLTPELVWTDVKGATTGKGLAVDAAIAQIAIVGVGPYSQLMITTGSQSGNSVVAIKGADGNIKWSWHIWATDYDPEAADNQHSINSFTFMDRSLGAMKYGYTANDLGAFGMYYQWGRKDPFPKPTTWTGAAGPTGTVANRITYNAEGTPTTVTVTAGQKATSYTITKPYEYITGTNWLWNSTWRKDLWGADTDVATTYAKSVYDPCPSGWRVPSWTAWSSLLDQFTVATNYQGANSKANIGTKLMYFASSGYFDASGVCQYTQYPYSWTTRSNGFNAGWFMVRDTGAGAEVNYDGYGGQASGYNLRCVKDWK